MAATATMNAIGESDFGGSENRFPRRPYKESQTPILRVT